VALLYAIDSDVSFDGKFMVYLARGAKTKRRAVSAACPGLTTLVHVETPITGGGYF